METSSEPEDKGGGIRIERRKLNIKGTFLPQAELVAYLEHCLGPKQKSSADNNESLLRYLVMRGRGSIGGSRG